jgi:hypothetical protein
MAGKVFFSVTMSLDRFIASGAATIHWLELSAPGRSLVSSLSWR